MNNVNKKSILESKKLEKDRLSRFKGLLMVCTGTACVSTKAFSIYEGLKEEIKKNDLDNDYLVIGTGCNGFCGQGPVMVLQPDSIFYQKLDTKAVSRIIKEHLLEGNPVEDYLFKDVTSGEAVPKMEDIPFFSKQKLVALRNKGLVDPESLDSSLARGGYEAIINALENMTPKEVLNEVKISGLRGRGGGGFPTGVKWESCIEAVKKTGRDPVIVCNADEGDPGAFMDRSIIETDPHTVIEGMLLGAYATGASEGFVYIRKEYPLALTRLEKAVADCQQKNLLGNNILGSSFSFDIEIHRGAGAFVCGESSALMLSMEGQVGEPRAKYIHSVESGYKQRPTVLNNVESFANIPVIAKKGGGNEFAKMGTGNVAENPWNGSSGTKVFSLVGNIVNTGLVEVPMGITMREIIFEIGGGIPDGREFKAVQTGGPSGGCLPESLLDEPVDFDSLTKAGSMMGSGGMIVMDDKTCMVDIARYFVEFLKSESCGKCTPCREGNIAVFEILDRICKGKGKNGDVELLEGISRVMSESSLCQLGSTACNPVLSTIKYFRSEYEAHIKDKKCPAGICKDLITYSINDNCTGCLLCIKPCPTDAISGEKKKIHVIDEQECIKCGVCDDVCKFNAVVIT